MVAYVGHCPGKRVNAMAFIPVENTVEAEMLMTLYGQRIENTLYFHREDAWDIPDMLLLAEALEAWWSDQIAPLITADVSLEDVIVTDLTSATTPSISLPVSPAIPGTAGGASDPGNVCITVSFRTAGRGRSSRGRNYISGLGESTVIGNTVSRAFADDCAAAYNNLLEPGTLPGDATWVVVSRFAAGAPRVEGTWNPIINAIVVDVDIDSQRRRLNGRGS